METMLNETTVPILGALLEFDCKYHERQDQGPEHLMNHFGSRERLTITSHTGSSHHMRYHF